MSDLYYSRTKGLDNFGQNYHSQPFLPPLESSFKEVRYPLFVFLKNRTFAGYHIYGLMDYIAENPRIAHFFAGKSDITKALFNHFIAEYNKIGNIHLVPTKTMIALTTGGDDDPRIAWVSQLGKNFVHVVFPFRELYPDNLCFTKMGQVPGSNQYNHHFRMYDGGDVNAEVKKFMKLAYKTLG